MTDVGSSSTGQILIPETGVDHHERALTDSRVPSAGDATANDALRAGSGLTLGRGGDINEAWCSEWR